MSKKALTPELEQFIEDMGLRHEEEGLPRMAGRLAGWLLVCEPPHQTAAELAEVLGASAGSISNVTRTLVQCGLVEKIAVPGQRSAYFRIRPDAWTAMMDGWIDKTRRMRELAERGLELLADRKRESRRRLIELRDFQRFIEQEVPNLLEKWKRRAQCLPILLAAGGLLPLPGAATAEIVVGIPDPAGGIAPVLSLHECVVLARQKNAALESERLRLGELKGQGWQAMSDGVPNLEVVGNVNRGRDPSFLLDTSFAPDEGLPDSIPGFLPAVDELPAQTFYRLSGNLTWELNPKRLFDSWKAVRLRLDQHEEDVAAATNATVETTMKTYFEVGLHQERISALDAEIVARREFLEITRRRFELDLATELDTLQAAVALANLGPELRRARKDLRNTSSNLNILMGRPAMAPLAVSPVSEVERDPIDVDGAMALALGRPELRSGEIQLAFLKKQRGALKADQWPMLRTFGSYGYVGRTTGSLFDDGHDFWNVDVALVWPFFDGFFTRGRVKETSASIARTEEQLVEGRRQARLAVATAIEELEAARENLAAAELNLTGAERALGQMTLRFDLGQASNLDVLNSQSERFFARSNLIEARFDVLTQTAVLKRAIGVDPSLTIAQIVAMFEGRTP